MNSIENEKPKEGKTFDEMMKEMDERRKHGESTDLDDPAVKDLIPEGERALRGEEEQMPAEETDEATLVDRLQDIRKKRKLAQKALTERFGNRGEQVPGTKGYAWRDSTTDSAYVVRKDGEIQEIKKGETWDFGQRGEHIWKRWKGSEEGWSDVNTELQEQPRQRVRRESSQTEVPRDTVEQTEKDLGAMSAEEVQAERARLIARLRELNVDISDIVSNEAKERPQPPDLDEEKPVPPPPNEPPEIPSWDNAMLSEGARRFKAGQGDISPPELISLEEAQRREEQRIAALTPPPIPKLNGAMLDSGGAKHLAQRFANGNGHHHEEPSKGAVKRFFDWLK